MDKHHRQKLKELRHTISEVITEATEDESIAETLAPNIEELAREAIELELGIESTSEDSNEDIEYHGDMDDFVDE